jgi:conjugative relaxase-like TrwC/TraI family protein
MLNITAQKNAEGAKAYFAKSDYYASVDEQEISGEWGGRAAVLLGLHGKVDKTDFDHLCDNLHPTTGEPITKITGEGRRVGYDFTWSAPKSVSVLHAMTGDDAILQAFRASVRETMDEMEAEMQTRVRKGNQDTDRTTGNWVWSEFVHLTSRPVNNVPCPQLHIHCFAQNMTFDVAEEQWKAGQFGQIKSYGYYWQAVQQASFARQLEEMGYCTRHTKDAFEIVGVPQSVNDRFSQRTSVIERVAAKLGITDPRQKAKLGATTREKKDSSIPYRELVELWNEWLTPDERVALLAVADKTGARERPVDNQRHSSFAVNHTFGRTAIAEERRLFTLALRHGVGEVTPDGVRDCFGNLGLLKREIAGRSWTTTKDVLAEERRMLAIATAGKGTCPAIAGEEPIHFKDERLSKDQLGAVEHVLRSTDSIMLIKGGAGTGKTTLAREVVDQIEARGMPVTMLAPSVQASRTVLRDEGFANADTLAKFLDDKQMQAGAANGVIFLDEAGLVSTQDTAKLFGIARDLHARVIAVGDHKQLASVGRGAAFRALQDIAGLPAAEVTDIKRQTLSEYREAVKLLANHQTAEGFDRLNHLGWIKLLPVWDSYRPVAEAYVAHCENKEGSLIVCPTHREATLITAAVRGQLKAHGLLGSEDHTLRRLVALQWSEAERGELSHYAGEEVLLFHRNVGSFKAGQQVRAGDVLDKLAAINPKYFSAFAADQMDVAAGDRIRVTARCKSTDGQHTLNNGASYRVKSLTPDGDLVLQNGWVLDQNVGTIAHDYVSTAHAAQGRSADHLILVQSEMSAPAGSRENFYVAVSRGRRSAQIFTDDRHALREAVQRSDPRITATELMNVPKASLWQRMRQKIERVEQAVWWAAQQAATDLHRQTSPKELHYER